MSNPKAIPACITFTKEGHNFIQHAKFTLIELLTESEYVSKATIKHPLKQRENFWISKLYNLTPKDLNQELSNY